MASKFLKTFSFILYGVVTFLLLCAVLVLIFKDDKTSCKSPPLSNVELSNLLNGTSSLVTSESKATLDGSGSAPVGEIDFTGHYELYSSENFDEFLTELGLGYFKRLAATRASSEYFISKNDDTYTLKTVSTFGEQTIHFKSGVDFSEDRMDGSTVTSTITVTGNKWVQKQVGGDTGEVTIVREWTTNPSEIKVTSVINEIVTIRKYKKIG